MNTDTQALPATIRRAQDELAEDAGRYPQLLAALRQADPGAESHLEHEVALEVRVGVLQVHSASLHEGLNDALADEA